MTHEEIARRVVADQRRARRIRGGQDVIEVPVDLLRRALRGDVDGAREALGSRTHDALLESAPTP